MLWNKWGNAELCTAWDVYRTASYSNTFYYSLPAFNFYFSIYLYLQNNVKWQTQNQSRHFLLHVTLKLKKKKCKISYFCFENVIEQNFVFLSIDYVQYFSENLFFFCQFYYADSILNLMIKESNVIIRLDLSEYSFVL